MALLMLVLFSGCPRDSKPDAGASTNVLLSAPVSARDASVAYKPGLEPVPLSVDGVVELQGLQLTVPEGFEIVAQTKSTVMLRHITDLTVTLGVTPSSDPAKDAQTVDAFLKTAGQQLSALSEAVVSPANRLLPGTKWQLKGVSAHTVDRRGTAVNERRDMWVMTAGSRVVTASFIYLEDAEASKAAIEFVMAMLRDGVLRLEGDAGAGRVDAKHMK